MHYAYGQALAHDPGHATAIGNLGAFLRIRGSAEAGEALRCEHLARQPTTFGARLNFAAELLREERGGAVTVSYGTLSLTTPNSNNRATDYGAILYGIYRAGPAYVSAIAYGGGAGVGR